MGQPKHLIGALRDFLLARPALSRLTSIEDGQASRDAALPYLILEAADSRSLRAFGAREVRWVTLQVTVLAATREQAEALAWRIRDALFPPDDAPPWAPLALRGDWQDVGRQPAGGDSVVLDPDARGPGGVDVWAARTPITWTTSRG